MEENFYIPWEELLWDGITVKGGHQVTGQLLRRGKDEYYICTTAYDIYREDEHMAPMIGRWHKVIPSTLKRTEFLVMTDEEFEEHCKRKFNEYKTYIESHPINLNDVEFDGYFTINESD